MLQIKKKFFTFFLLLNILCLNIFTVKAEEIPVEDQSEVVDQKSIIEEQTLDLPEAGVGKIWNGDYTIQELIEIGPIPQKIIMNPYAETIHNLTEEEKELICRITYREAGNQPIKGQRAVIEVILNRLRSDNWPDDVVSVLSAPGQFSTWKARHRVTKEQIEEMKEVLLLVEIHDTNILPSEEYVYFNCAHAPKNSIKIKGHWFWK